MHIPLGDDKELADLIGENTMAMQTILGEDVAYTGHTGLWGGQHAV